MNPQRIDSIPTQPVTNLRPVDPLQKSAKGSWKVLIVDDDAMVCRVSARMLHESEVWTAESGDEACRLLEARAGEAVDCVLLDMRMPGLTFEESFEGIRRICPDVPVIACSGNTAEALGEGFASAPGTGFLSKPFTRAELKGAIGRAVSGSSPND